MEVTHSEFNSPAMSIIPSDANMLPPHHRYKTFSSTLQYQTVLATLNRLEQSGFYWGAIGGQEADTRLSAEPTGTFLLRDSSDDRHFFSLSVKTASGTENLRIHQCSTDTTGAQFSLQTDDADPESILSMVPRFDCVLKLVHYYMPQGYMGGYTRSGDVYYIYSGGEEKVPLELIQPLFSRLSLLQHM